MVNIIALNGKMGSGKSEAFKYIQKAAEGREVVLVKFAQPLYDIQEFAYERIKSVYERPETFIKDRKLLQWLGTDWGRELNRHLWVSLWRTKALEAVTEGKLVICDDARFDNEAEIIKSLGGTIVQIFSSRTEERIDTNAGIKNHASENGIDPKFVDIIIENNGTLPEYQYSLSILCKKLGLGNNNKAEYIVSE